ncbi:MAG: DUF4300 family protein [Lachnospiraceae bacterium]
MRLKRVFAILLTLTMLAAVSCGSKKTDIAGQAAKTGSSEQAEQTEQAQQDQEIESFEDGEINEANLRQVCQLLNQAGLSNTDIFAQWVKDTAAIDLSEESNGFTDANCRLTVMLLAGDLIKYDKLEDHYQGTYLMYDLDVLENQENYSVLKDKESLLTTMFGEMPLPESGSGDELLADALSENWKSHGIKMESDKCSIISIIFSTVEMDQAFVGHTGILIDCRDMKGIDSDYVFVEKIAFGEPFKITKVKDIDELIKIFSERPDYTVMEDEPAPVVYQNEKRIGKLHQ